MSEPQSTAQQVAQQFFEGLDEHNAEIFDELIAEDVTTGIYRADTDEDVSGREGMQSLWQEYWEAFPDLTGVSTEFVQEGERIAVFRKEEGTHEGEFRGIPATGEEITFEYSGYLDIEHDQIAHAYFHGDMLNLAKQLEAESPFSQS